MPYKQQPVPWPGGIATRHRSTGRSSRGGEPLHVRTGPSKRPPLPRTHQTLPKPTVSNAVTQTTPASVTPAALRSWITRDLRPASQSRGGGGEWLLGRGGAEAGAEVLGRGRPCAAEPARLHCSADGAYLCPGCDTRAHGAGSRHARVWLCEVCEHAPAAVTCRADTAALCAACDSDIHSANPLARHHERLPVAPFGAPQPFPSPAFAAGVQEEAAAADDDGSNEAEAASWLLAEPDNSHEDSASADAFFADSGGCIGADLDFAWSIDGIKAIGVPVAPPEMDLTGGGFFYPERSMNHSVSSLEVAMVPDALEAGAPSVAVVASKGKEREARLMRYREKRKNRQFDKTTWYASRKAYAETRPRIKGRFAKRCSAEAENDHDAACCSPAVSVPAASSDGDYGVVPSF